MFSITYDTWKSVCNMFFNQKQGVLKSYLQWFPFSKLSKEDKELISSNEYFDNFICSGACLLFNRGLLRTDNYMQKGDGSFRNSSLVSPILYLILQSIGKILSDVYISQRPNNISVYYAGNYKAMRCHYKQDYDDFYKELNSELEGYHYFIKTDIREFFGNINLNLLIRRIDEIVNADVTTITQHHLQLYKELLSYCGNGKFPLIENSVASSYIATIIYLDEVDIALNHFISEKISAFNNFKIIRYVDDLFILISSDKPIGYLHEAYNEIRNEYSSILKEYGLSLNTGKCSFKPTSEINSELKKSLYDEYFNGQKCEIAALCPNGVKIFVNRLREELLLDYITVEKYNEIVEDSFAVKDIEFTPSEIFNFFVYENNDDLQSDEIKTAILELVRLDVSFISLDPKRLTLMIMKTGSDDSIKVFLNYLFNRYRSGKWNSYDTTISINYLIQGQFRHIDLLVIIQNYCPKLYEYYCYFCKHSFASAFDDFRKRKLCQMLKGDKKSYYLYFMSIVELSKNNIMGAFAYFKNYFDRVTAHLAFFTGYDKGNGKKPNYNNFYEENKIKQFYANIDGSEDIIKQAHKLRNSNPLAHAGADLIDNNDSSHDLRYSIKDMNELIYNFCKKNDLF